MTRIGAFTPEQARELWQDYLSRKRSQPLRNQRAQDVSPHRVYVRSLTNEVIPEFACMQIMGVELHGGQTVVAVAKPETTSGRYLFNGPYKIDRNGYGWAYRFGIIVMLGDEPTQPNVNYTPVIDSWEIEEGAGPFVVFGKYESELTDRSLIGQIDQGTTVKIELGQVRRCLGKGWYEVNKAGEWSGVPREILDWASDPNINGIDEICGSYGSRGSIGGSGSGSGSGSGADGCDECQDVETLNCLNRTGDANGYFVPVDSPGPPVVEEVVYAHTFHPILYSIGSWLKIVKRPDVIDEGVINRSGASGSTGGASGSGSGSGPAEPDYIGKRYDIVDGQVPLRELVIPEYQLCRNETTGECTVILARTSTIYFPHMKCGTVELDQCREVTTSGTPSGAE